MTSEYGSWMSLQRLFLKWTIVKIVGQLSRFGEENGLDDPGSIPGRGKRFFSIPQRPDQIWGPSSLLFNGHGGYFSGVKRRGVKLTIHLHLMPRSRMVKLHLHYPIRLHGVVLNSLSTGTTSPIPHCGLVCHPSENYGTSLLYWSFTHPDSVQENLGWWSIHSLQLGLRRNNRMETRQSVQILVYAKMKLACIFLIIQKYEYFRCLVFLIEGKGKVIPVLS
jgi:hypothetical protein